MVNFPLKRPCCENQYDSIYLLTKLLNSNHTNLKRNNCPTLERNHAPLKPSTKDFASMRSPILNGRIRSMYSQSNGIAKNRNKDGQNNV